jgi:hypothetical protein
MCVCTVTHLEDEEAWVVRQHLYVSHEQLVGDEVVVVAVVLQALVVFALVVFLFGRQTQRNTPQLRSQAGRAACDIRSPLLNFECNVII